MDSKEKMDKIQDFCLMDDVFFEAFAQDIPAMQEILGTILENDKLVVEDVIVQSSERNLYGRSVRLDAVCTLGDGCKCNVEVQRSDNDNHLKRARYNASIITIRSSHTKDKFDDILDVYVVYISEFDFLQGGLTVYHIDKTIRENGETIDDGVYEIFVNTVIKDGSSISELMTCFTEKNVDSPNFPAVTRRFKELKSEEGSKAVCDIMEIYLAEARAEEKKAERASAIQKLIQKGFAKELILSLDYTEAEISEAEALLMTTV